MMRVAPSHRLFPAAIVNLFALLTIIVLPLKSGNVLAAEPDGQMSESTSETPDPHTLSLVFGFFFHLPHYLIEADRTYPTTDQFLGYPYEGGEAGYMIAPTYRRETVRPAGTADGDWLIGAVDARVVPSYRTRPFSFRMLADHSYDLETMHRTRFSWMVETRYRFGLEGSAALVRSGIDADEPERAGVGDLNVVYRFAQSPRIQMRTGVGGQLSVDRGGTVGGANFTYGVDGYPIRPLVISAAVDFGNLGTDFHLHARGHFGLVFRSFEIYAGWDIDQVGLRVVHGPLAGLRVWI